MDRAFCSDFRLLQGKPSSRQSIFAGLDNNPARKEKPGGVICLRYLLSSDREGEAECLGKER